MVHHVEVQVLILLLIASLVGMLARRVHLPYTLALVLAGLGLSLVHLEALRDLSLTPELLLLLFLPPLLFEAAYHLPFDDLKKNGAHIAFLALAGVVVSVSLIGMTTYAALGSGDFGWTHAFLFASVIAATDPISVLSLFKELGAPKRLYQIVEGESLINDGVAVVIFAIVAAVAGLPSGHGELVELEGAREIAVFALVTFVKTAAGGLAVGGALGALVSLLTRQIDDHLIEITLTTLVAWGSFLLAEELHVSGVLSTVTAGVFMGSFGKHFGMSASTRVAVNDFWQYMGFLSNSFIFLLIGLELEPRSLFQHAPAVSVGFVSVVGARAALVYLGIPLVDRWATPLPAAWRHVLVWGGIRGSLSMVLVLGLPESFAGRTLLINLVFGVVAVSLFLQGLSMSPLMRRLGLSPTDASPEDRQYEVARATAVAARRVLVAAGEQLERGVPDEASYREILSFYAARRETAQATLAKHSASRATPERLLEAARALAMMEREALNYSAATGLVSEAAAAELLASLDLRVSALNESAHDGGSTLQETLDRLYELRPKGASPR